MVVPIGEVPRLGCRVYRIGGPVGNVRERRRCGCVHRLFWGYRVTSPTRKRTPLGPYRIPMHRILGGSYGAGCFLMVEDFFL